MARLSRAIEGLTNEDSEGVASGSQASRPAARAPTRGVPMATRSLILALCLSTVVSGLAASQQQPATIPTELAVALLDHGESQSGNRTPRIVVGRAPAGIPASLTQAEGAVIVGGV